MTQPTAATIKALAFDFDGTLADSFPVFVHGVEYALNRKPFTPEEIEELRQYSAREVVRILKVKAWKLPFLVTKGMREMDRHQGDITIFPGVADTLKTLRERGYTLYIVSSHSGKGITLFLKKYGLENDFDYIYSKAGLFGKPKALRKLQARFNYLSSECLFIGDEVRDIEAANKANVRCVSVSWGFNTKAALQSHNPSSLIDKPEELIEVVKSLS
ncbi:MAG TPA: HAD-IA family hydrolase [Verrucomicrobiae bacterium]|nr:HAD-IA family hydrolase [Verrucomicrobiae bacterium]